MRAESQKHQRTGRAPWKSSLGGPACFHVNAMGTVRANGLDIAYDRVGEGPALVFAHGAAEDGRVWQPQLAALADSFTVVAWDEPGAGRSSDLPVDFGLADYARCLAAVIDALGLGPAHVAGLSWGGTVVQELYRHRPELVATLILADTYAGWKGSLPEDEVHARVKGAEEMLAAAPGKFDPTLPGLFAGDPPSQFLPLLEEMAADVRPHSVRNALRVMAEADQRDLLPRIAVPTLLIWGELDARSPLNVARQFEETIPNPKLTVIPGAGHTSNLERPKQFNDAVREFCRAHPPRSARTRSPPALCTGPAGACASHERGRIAVGSETPEMNERADRPADRLSVAMPAESGDMLVGTP